jgi:hypothetical protein
MIYSILGTHEKIDIQSETNLDKRELSIEYESLKIYQSDNNNVQSKVVESEQDLNTFVAYFCQDIISIEYLGPDKLRVPLPLIFWRILGQL